MADLLATSDEHRLVHETVTRLFAAPEHLSRSLAESGLLALPFDAADGGLHDAGSSDRTSLAVAFAAKGEMFGTDTRLLQAVLGGGLVAASASVGRATLAEAVVAGDSVVAAGLHEPRARTNLHHCATQATVSDAGWTISGTKSCVIGAQGATHLVVLARIGDRTSDPAAGLGLFLIDGAATGLDYRHYRLRDGSPASDVHLEAVALPADALIAGPGIAAGLLAHAVCQTRLCLAAEASGLVRAAVRLTAAYTQERRQFGQAIGNFQVVQHRLADMAVMADQCAALVADVAVRSDDLAAVERAHRAVADMGMTVAKAAIQLHGGYGMTEDLPFGQMLRRMMTISLLF